VHSLFNVAEFIHVADEPAAANRGMSVKIRSLEEYQGKVK